STGFSGQFRVGVQLGGERQARNAFVPGGDGSVTVGELGRRVSRPPVAYAARANPVLSAARATSAEKSGAGANSPVALTRPAAPSSAPGTRSSPRKRSRSTGPGSQRARVGSAEKPKRA